MAPIRTAIIGLSSSSSRSWAAGAHLPYLVSGRGREKYTITALCNSSIESARKAIKLHNLNPETTKAYGDPKEVAEDPDIDLVVCCTRVDVHYSTILPSIQAGKAVFVEWPLAHDLEHATKLAEAAKKSGARTMINVQGRVAPPILRMRQVVESGCIGKVVSSEVRASGGVTDRQTLPQFLDYFLDRSIGGNIFTIGFGHSTYKFFHEA